MMKKLTILSILLTSLCMNTMGQIKPAKADTTQTNTPFKQKDTSNWVVNFREFRDALYQSDKTKAKAFFNFPFKNEGNDIWYLIYDGDEKAMQGWDEAVKPLTEKDFDKYFHRIFYSQFIKCFLKIKLDELYKKGQTESPSVKDSATTYKLYATYNKKNKTIELNLSLHTPYKVSETEYEAGESSYIYRFEILRNGHIKFRAVLIAG